MMTRQQIERAFELFGTVLAASTLDTQRRRTAYFYRKEAISWARMARQSRSVASYSEGSPPR
jgi:hypothetical protein